MIKLKCTLMVDTKLCVCMLCMCVIEKIKSNLMRPCSNSVREINRHYFTKENEFYLKT